MSAKHTPGPRKVHPRVSDERCRAVPPSNALAYALALDLLDARRERDEATAGWDKSAALNRQLHGENDDLLSALTAAQAEAEEVRAMNRTFFKTHQDREAERIEVERTAIERDDLRLTVADLVARAEAAESEVARLRGALEDVRDIARDLETAEAIARAALPAPEGAKEDERA